MLIQTINNLTINAPKTYLASSVNAGTNVLPFKNNPGFSSSWAIQIGNTGESQSEIVLLTTGVPGGTLGTVTANTLYDHPSDTPIFGVKYDKLVFERSTTGTAGTATVMTNGTVPIQTMSTVTFFDDTTGTTTYAYKTFFQASQLLVNSTESDWITFPSLQFYSLSRIKQRVKDKLISAGYVDGINIDDAMVEDWINEWLEQMTNTAIDVNEDYQLGTATLAFNVNQEIGTIPMTDFKGGFKRVWVADPSGTYQATKMDSNSFSPNKTFTNTYPYFYMQGDNIIGRMPSDLQGTMIFEYYKLNPVLTEDTDTLPITMRGYTKSFVDYGHAQALFKDQKIQEATMKIQEANQMMQKFKTEISPRNVTGVTLIDIVEDTGNNSEIWL